MNCRSFCEIADTYLSDELLVETNHEVFQHLENCADCRQELAGRREIRQKLRIACKDSPEFQMNAMFAARLKTVLKESSSPSNSRFNWKFLTPVFASLLVAAISLTFVLIYRQDSSYAAELSKKAVTRHEDCGLKNISYWKENRGKIAPEKAVFVKSLKDETTEIIDVHDCKFEDKTFVHYILLHKGKLVSVLKVASAKEIQPNTSAGDSIVCERKRGLQVSRFTVGKELVFVISEMSETENLNIARKLSDAVKI